jgi:predicted dienelactone hydrolase
MSRFISVSIAVLLFLAGLGRADASPQFERLEIADPGRQPVEIGVWSPEGGGGPRPLVVISHGTGGDYRSHADTAEALARAGFVVAALTHSGDNWRDRSMVLAVWQRPRQLRLLVDYMLGGWAGRGRIDPARVGAFGFSAGGFTVLVAGGGVPELGRIGDHCRQHPDFFDCRLMGSVPIELLPRTEWVHDRRIRAIVVAAPALAFTFGRPGLAGVRSPVQLWAGGADQILPAEYYAEAVRRDLPIRPEYRRVAEATHFDFLKPCQPVPARQNPELCASRPGFDRVAFHARFNREVADFLRRRLRPQRRLR